MQVHGKSAAGSLRRSRQNGQMKKGLKASMNWLEKIYTTIQKEAKKEGAVIQWTVKWAFAPTIRQARVIAEKVNHLSSQDPVSDAYATRQNPVQSTSHLDSTDYCCIFNRSKYKPLYCTTENVALYKVYLRTARISRTVCVLRIRRCFVRLYRAIARGSGSLSSRSTAAFHCGWLLMLICRLRACCAS